MNDTLPTFLTELNNLLLVPERLDERIEYMFKQWFIGKPESTYSETITKFIIRELVFVKTGKIIPTNDCAKDMRDFQQIVEGMIR